MFVKMGYKIMTYGTEKYIRIYTKSIKSLATDLNVPSSNNSWESLSQFLSAVETGERIEQPYTRNVLVTTAGRDPIPVHLSINKHGRTSQSYIVAGEGTWLNQFVDRFLNRDFNFEYLVGPHQDILVVPSSDVDLTIERKNDEVEIRSRVQSFCKRKNFAPPPNAREIGLNWELEEVDFLKREGFHPSHRFPYLTSRIESLRPNNISCDIDLLDSHNDFVKHVEVKSIAGAPGNPFPLTINEWQSRERCRVNETSYEIVVYYHTGQTVLERRVIAKDEGLVTRPLGYFCSFP
ncbi:MAG: DUF3883 domain-containing protein [Candidatus Methanoperedens sp.]|nr:DUF3883 domain-containing protein [Candidatus Methanoperedens sp.]